MFTFDCANNGRERRGQARWHVWEGTDDVEVLILGEGKNYDTLMSIKNCKSKLIENDWNPTVALGSMAELMAQSRKVSIWCTHTGSFTFWQDPSGHTGQLFPSGGLTY